MHVSVFFFFLFFLNINRVIDDMGSLPELAYHGLKLLCLPKHGEGTNVHNYN